MLTWGAVVLGYGLTLALGWAVGAAGPYTIGWSSSQHGASVSLHRRPHGAQVAWVSAGPYGLKGGTW